MDQALSWDSAIEKESSFTLLPAGEACFQVIGFERARHEPRQGGKIPACPKANIEMKVWNTQGEETTIKENLLLFSTLEWKLCQFFNSLGHRQSGEKFKPDWSRVMGSMGRIMIKIDRYQKNDGTQGESNKIAEFLKPVEGQPVTRPQAPLATPTFEAPAMDTSF